MEHDRRDAVRLVALLTLLVLGVVAVWWIDLAAPEQWRSRVAAATGPWAGVLFVLLYGGACLLPLPKAALTIAAGAVFGLAWGAVLSLTAALLGASIAFALARSLGRAAVARMTGPRAARVERRLETHGFWAVLALRLVPVAPFTAINYAAGVSSVRWSAYVAASTVGMVPGTVAYAAVGAFGLSDPWGVGAVATAAVVILSVVAAGARWWLARRAATTTGAGDA